MTNKIGLSLLTGAVALSVTLALPGAATAEPGPAPHKPAASLLAALARDLGLTTEQAATRITQEDRAGVIEERLRRSLGASYGGAWFDTATGTLTAAVTDVSAIGTVTAEGATPRLVTHSLAALDAVKTRIDDLASRRVLPDGVAGWFADPRTNSVVLEVTAADRDTPAVRDFVRHARSRGAMVRVAEVTASWRPEADVAGGAYFSTGGKACSVGFTARGANGSRHFVTAGHCTRPGGSVTGYNGTFLGRTDGSTFGRRGDYGKVNVTSNNWTLKPWVNTWPGVRIVTGAQERAVNSSVCRSGWKSTWRCGQITAKNRTVNYGGGIVVEGLTQTTACSSPGDSGGSHISGGQAQGVHSGGPSSGCGALFQPIREVLNAYNLRLVVG
ncbi:S1 family peptidase [Micromonospora marina]|uniref:S1 family peptidase n=1 Tax=Micromonospora marina TaxID=307120 RepID=UPI0034535FA7